MPLRGKVALVTGAARGIGAAIADAFGLGRELGPQGIRVNAIAPGFGERNASRRSVQETGTQRRFQYSAGDTFP